MTSPQQSSKADFAASSKPYDKYEHLLGPEKPRGYVAPEPRGLTNGVLDEKCAETAAVWHEIGQNIATGYKWAKHKLGM